MNTLFEAIGSGDLETVKSLIEQGADIHLRDANGRTALHYAAWNGHFEVVKHLVECGADVNAKTNNGKTALHYASGEAKEFLRNEEERLGRR